MRGLALLLALMAATAAAGEREEELVRELLSGNDARRRIALLEFARLGEDAYEGVPLLARALANDDTEEAAAQALGLIGEPAIPTLVVDVCRDVRSHSEDALVRIGKPCVPLLIPALESDSTDAALGAVMVVSRLGPFARDAVPALRELADGEDYAGALAGAALTLVAEEPTDALPWLIRDLESSSGPTDETLMALARLGTSAREVLPRMRKRLPSLSPRERIDLLKAIWCVSEDADEVVPGLVALLKHEDDYTRGRAAAGLAMIGSPANSAIPALLDSIEAAFDGVPQDDYYDALASIRPGAEVRERVRPWLETKSANGRASGAFVAGLIEAYPEELLALTRDEITGVAVTAIWALGDFETLPPGALRRLLELAEHEDSDIAYSALRMLEARKAHAETIVPVLRRVIVPEDGWHRWHAAEVLGRLGPPARAAIPDLIRALKGENETLRRAAADTLGRFGDDASRAIPALRRALRHEERHFAIASAVALWRIRGSSGRSLELLMGELADPEYAHSAVRALGDLGPAARPASEQLAPHLRHPGLERRCEAAYAWWRIRGDTKTAVRLLVHCLVACPREFSAGEAVTPISYLKEMGPAAGDALPALRPWTREIGVPRSVRTAATEAILAIEARK